jgi:hypothetical protein
MIFHLCYALNHKSALLLLLLLFLLLLLLADHFVSYF